MPEAPSSLAPSSIHACGLPEPVAEGLAAAGLDVGGVLAIEAWDVLVPPAWRASQMLPGARSALLLGSVGARLSARLAAAGVRPDPDGDPIDDWVREAVSSACARISASGGASWAGFAFEPVAGSGGGPPRFADFIALAQACGLGVPGRLRLLLHPSYGPWLSLRACLLTDLALAAHPALADFDPCGPCAAPCAAACPAGAVPVEGLDLALCTATRLARSDCASGCAARAACIVGPENAPTPEWIGHHAWHSLRHLRAVDSSTAR